MGHGQWRRSPEPFYLRDLCYKVSKLKHIAEPILSHGFNSRMMAPRQNGLIVNVSSFGGIKYLHNVCYGVGKAACDRMAADCAVELKQDNVTVVSLWPGPAKTEMIHRQFLDNPDLGMFQIFSLWSYSN